MMAKIKVMEKATEAAEAYTAKDLHRLIDKSTIKDKNEVFHLQTS
jgi:ribosomal protein L19E